MLYSGELATGGFGNLVRGEESAGRDVTRAEGGSVLRRRKVWRRRHRNDARPQDRRRARVCALSVVTSLCRAHNVEAPKFRMVHRC